VVKASGVYTVSREDNLLPQDRDIVLHGLKEFNRKVLPPPQFAPVAFLLRDADGRVAGGIMGQTGWNWLHIHWLWIEETVRTCGHGRRLLEAAEREATSRGCHGSWVDTFTCQAPGFYQKCGYAIFGELPNYPEGGTRSFWAKSLISV
jgi:ribosomal protein S18 acetylase RimI-like enzyme